MELLKAAEVEQVEEPKAALPPKEQDQAEDHLLIIPEGSEDYSPMSNLPDLCLRKIFLLLPIADKFRVEMVCTRWNEIGRECWSNITEISSRWPLGAWKIIAPRTTKSLRDLKLRLPTENLPYKRKLAHEAIKVLTSVEPYCVRLKKLSVSLERMESFTKRGFNLFRSMISKNRGLKSIKLWYLPIFKEHEAFEAISSFTDLIPSEIEEIFLLAEYADEEEVNPFVVSGGLSRFKNLHTLALFHFAIDDPLLKGIETLEHLRVLKLKYLFSADELFPLTKLECLEIPSADICGTSLKKIIKNNAGLKRLDISESHQADSSVFQLVCKLKDLEELIMKEMFDLEERDLIRLPASLKLLNLNDSFWLTDKGIQRLFSLHSSMAELHLSGVDFSVGCYKTAIKWVTQTGKSLKMVVDSEMYDLWESWKLDESRRPNSILANLNGNFQVIKCDIEDDPS